MIEAGIEALRREPLVDCSYNEAYDLAEDVIRSALAVARPRSFRRWLLLSAPVRLIHALSRRLHDAAMLEFDPFLERCPAAAPSIFIDADGRRAFGFGDGTVLAEDGWKQPR